MDHSYQFKLIWPGRGESTPLHLRIYANNPSIIDFSDAESTRPQLDISLLEGQIEVTEYPLRVAAFANIHSLSLFFVSALWCSPLIQRLWQIWQSEPAGGERSRIFDLGFKGETTSLRTLKTSARKLTCQLPMPLTHRWWTSWMRRPHRKVLFNSILYF